MLPVTFLHIYISNFILSICSLSIAVVLPIHMYTHYFRCIPYPYVPAILSVFLTHVYFAVLGVLPIQIYNRFFMYSLPTLMSLLF